MKSFKRFFIILLTFNMIFLTGCCNYREVEKISMVAGVAIDKGQNGNNYHLTFEFLDLSGDQPKSKLLEADGETLFDAVRNSISKTENKLFFSHSKVIIVSQEIAEEGISKILDFWLRDAEMRLTTNLVISKAESAADIIKQKPVTNQLVCTGIAETITNKREHLETNPDVKLYQAYNMISNEGISLILPSVKVSKSGEESIVELDGTSVFKKDKLSGFLSPEETKYFLYIRDEIQGGLLIINDRSKEKNTSIEVLSSKTKVKPEISNDNLTMDIKVTTKIVWAENQSDDSDMGEVRIKQIENETKMNIENNITKLIKKVQKEYNSDIFGFGSTISKYNPHYWENVKEDWNNIFPNLNFKVTSDVQLVNTACTKTKAEVKDIG